MVEWFALAAEAARLTDAAKPLTIDHFARVPR
jgi:hypothetical protein